LRHFNPTNPFELVDVFVGEHKPFDDLFNNRMEVSAFNVVIPVMGVSDLIAMKLSAGREKDLYDVSLLRKKINHGTE